MHKSTTKIIYIKIMDGLTTDNIVEAVISAGNMKNIEDLCLREELTANRPLWC